MDVLCASPPSLKGLFGALRDAGPDYWGRRVIEKHAGVAALGELDYLVARREGVSERDCTAISSSFAYEGFHLD